MKSFALLLLATASICGDHVPGHVEVVNAAVMPVQALPVGFEALPSQQAYILRVDGNAPTTAYVVPLAPVYGKASIVHTSTGICNGNCSSLGNKNKENAASAMQKNIEPEPLKASPNMELKPIQTAANSRSSRSYGFYIPNSGVYDQHGVRTIVPEITDSYINYYPMSVAEYPLSVSKGLLTSFYKSL